MLAVRAHERPASTGPVGQRRDADKHGTQAQPIAKSAARDQRCIGQLVDGEPRGRDHEEAARRAPNRHAVVRKRQPVVTRERLSGGNEPAARVGDQRPQAAKLDEKNDHGEVHSCRGNADDDEPAQAPGCRPQAGGLLLSPASTRA